MCAHEKLTDPWAFGEICKIASSSKQGARPSAGWWRGETSLFETEVWTVRHDHQDIPSRVSIEIEVVRYLGKVKSELDQLWRTQCRATKG